MTGTGQRCSWKRNGRRVFGIVVRRDGDTYICRNGLRDFVVPKGDITFEMA